MKNANVIAIVAAFALAPSASAFAQSATSTQTLRAVAQQSGLSERKVRMLVGNRSGFAEYRATYERSQKKLVRAIGQDNYERLLSGQPIELSQPAPATRVAAVDEKE